MKRATIRRRHIALVIALAALACLGVLTFRAATATPGPLVDYAGQVNRLVAESQPAPASAPDGWDEWASLAIDLNTAMFAERERAGPPDVPVAVGLGWPVDFSTAADPLAPAQLRRQTEDFMARMAESGLDARIAAAATYPRAARTIPSGGRLIDVLYPELGALRHVAHYQAARMRLAAAAGDWDAFATAFDGAIQPAHVLTHQGFLLDHLVGYSICRSTLAELESHLADVPDAATLERLADSLERARPGPITIAFKGERALTFDVIQHIYTDNGKGDGRLIMTEFKAIVPSGAGEFVDALPANRAANLAAPLFASKKQITARANAIYDSMDEWLNSDPRSRPAGSMPPTSAVNNLPYRYMALRSLLPAWGKALQTHDKSTLQVTQARIAIALEQYRMARGGYPDSLDQLVPAYLHSIPIHDATGATFAYRHTPGAKTKDTTTRGGYSLTPLPPDAAAPESPD